MGSAAGSPAFTITPSRLPGAAREAGAATPRVAGVERKADAEARPASTMSSREFIRLGRMSRDLLCGTRMRRPTGDSRA